MGFENFSFGKAKNEIKKVARKAGMIVGLGAATAGSVAMNATEAFSQSANNEKNLKTIVVDNPNDPRLRAHDDSLFIAKGSELSKKQLFDPKMTSEAFAELKKEQEKNPDIQRAMKNLHNPQPAMIVEKELPDQISIKGLAKGLLAMYGLSKGPIEQKHLGKVKIYAYPKQKVVLRESKSMQGKPTVAEKNSDFDKNPDYKKKLELYNNTQAVLGKFRAGTGANTSTFETVKPEDVPAIFRDAKIPVKNYIKVHYSTEAVGEGDEFQYIPNYEKPVQPVIPKPKKEAVKKGTLKQENGSVATPKQAEKKKMTPDAYLRDVPNNGATAEKKSKEAVTGHAGDTLHRQPAPNMPGINLLYDKPGGKILFFENRNGKVWPYKKDSIFPKGFQFPDPTER